MRFIPWLTLVVGFASAVGTGSWMSQEVEREARADFAARAADLADGLASRIRAYSDVTYSIRALMAREGAARINRDQFHQFVAALAIPERYPGLANISYTYHVPHAARAAFEQRMEAEWQGLRPRLSRFEIKPPGERPEYEVVSYIEPVLENAIAIGLDLSTDPVRSDAVRRARDSGALSTTAGMTLLRDGASPTKSVLLRLAVYEGIGVPSTLELRRQAFVGVAGVAIRLGEMLNAALPVKESQHVRVVIHDVTDQEMMPAGSTLDDRLLFDSAGTSRDGTPHASAPSANAAIERINVGNRTWELRIEPLAGFIEQKPERALPYVMAAVVFMIALLLFGLQRSLATAKAQGIVLRRNVKTLEFHRRRLAETQEIAKIGGWEWDIRERRQTWSDQLYLMLGRAVGDPLEPTVEFFISRIVHAGDIPIVREALKRVVEIGSPVAIECRVVLPDGEERIISAVTRLEAADDGQRTRVVGTVRDITDGYRAAARERAQLIFVQTMMDAIPTPVFQKDPNGRFRVCNDAWCQFIGKDRDAIIGRTIDELLPGPHEAIREQDRTLMTRPATSAIEVRMPDAKGDLRQLLVHKASYLADDGTIAGLVGVIFDITDRKLAEDRLEQTIGVLDRRNKMAKLLSDFGEMLLSCVTSNEAYEAVAKYIPQFVPGGAGALYRIDAAHGRGDKTVSWGPAGAESMLATGDCVAVRLGRPRFVADSAAELNCRHLVALPPRSYACLPLSAQGELIGMLYVQAGADSAGHDPETERALISAGEHIALALANLALRETLREEASHDKLTGLYNRHYLNARFEQELSRTQRKHESLAVVMLDIDHFKRFNDTFGHAAGDHVLRELAATISRAGRVSDVACRYGGEEFVLFMPETTPEVALKRANGIREMVKSLHLEWEGQALGSVTLSAGVAAYPEHGNTPEVLLRFADQALYRAKELGRDRVVLAPMLSTIPPVSKPFA